MLRKAAYLVNVNADFVSPKVGAESVLFNKSKFFSFAKLPSHHSVRYLDETSPQFKDSNITRNAQSPKSIHNAQEDHLEEYQKLSQTNEDY